MGRPGTLRVGRPIDGALRVGRPIEGMPTEGKPIDGTPMEGRPIEGRVTEGRPIEGTLIVGTPAEGKLTDGMLVVGVRIDETLSGMLNGGKLEGVWALKGGKPSDAVLAVGVARVEGVGLGGCIPKVALACRPTDTDTPP